MVEKLVTVFGGSGFVGRHVVRALAKSGYRIRVAVRHPSDAYFLQPLGDVGQIAIQKCDIRNPEQVLPLVVNTYAVVNLVGILKSSGGQNFDAVHVEGAHNIAEAAAKAGTKKFVHISALGAAADAKSHYARSKAEGEAAVRAAFPGATILRPSIVFGPEDHFFNRFAALMRLARFVFPVIAGGTKFQPVFAGDVACAVTHALSNEAAAGRTYELTGPGVYTFRNLIRFIARTTERDPLLIGVPFWLLNLGAMLTGWLPGAPITYDQAKLLRKDNVASGQAGVGTLADLGVAPTAVEAIVPNYLWAYRPSGQYAEARGA